MLFGKNGIRTNDNVPKNTVGKQNNTSENKLELRNLKRGQEVKMAEVHGSMSLMSLELNIN